MKCLVILGFLGLASAAAVAQDAVKTLPDNYRITFENDHVRVTRVHYPGNAKLPGHSHTSLPTAYVYLNDAGPVAFKHIGLEYGAVTRPPTVAGSYRLFRGLEEIHEVENLSARPSDFLRVEFKTDPGPDPRTLRGKFLPPATRTVGANVEFENAQLRITRLIASPGQLIEIASAPLPSLLVSLDASDLGNATWLADGHRHVAPAPPGGSEVLRFQLKTHVKTSRQ
jgi:hypothetical protein